MYPHVLLAILSIQHGDIPSMITLITKMHLRRTRHCRELEEPTIVKKRPNSGSRSTTSPSVNINCGFLSFLHWSTIAICCAATDNTGSSIRLNSSKHPQEPDCARPTNEKSGEVKKQSYIYMGNENRIIECTWKKYYLCRFCPDLCSPSDQNSWKRPHISPGIDPYPSWFRFYQYPRDPLELLREPCPRLEK